jgi:predicted membrane metal-binding protein
VARGCNLEVLRSPVAETVAPVLALAGWCAAGFFWAAFVAGWKLSDELPRADERRDLRVAGVVEGLPEPGDHGWRFRFRVDRNLSRRRPRARAGPARVVLPGCRPCDLAGGAR